MTAQIIPFRRRSQEPDPAPDPALLMLQAWQLWFELGFDMWLSMMGVRPSK